MFARCWLVCLVVCCVACRPEVARSEPKVITISVVSTNDVHGRISQLPLLGGYVDNLRRLRKQTGGAVLMLDAGDIFQGTLESNATEGAAMVRAYQALGYDAATLGNHEFDFGPVGPSPVPASASDDPLGALKQRVAQASFPFLNANLRREDGQALAIPKLRASVLLRPAGVPVGVIGGVTEDVLRTTHAANTRGIVVQRLGAALAAEAQRMRAAGARLVIALVHAGGECRDLRASDDLHSCESNSEVFRLARELPAGSVDVIVAGHTHAGLAQRVNGIAIIEAFSNGRAFGRVDVTFDAKKKPRVEIFAPTELCLDALDKPSCAKDASYAERPVQRSERVLSAIAEDLKRAKVEREQLLGVTVTSPVWRESRSESPLNNLVADLMLRASPGADAAFTNAGGVRIPLPVGPLRYGTVFEMFPFDNTFATLRLTAAQLAAIVAKNAAASNGILALSGATAAVSCEGSELRVRLFTAKGELIDPQQKLRVVTSDFLASSGDGLLAGMQLDKGAIEIARDRPIRDALLDGLRELPGGKLSGDDKQLFDRAHPRIRLATERPVRCR
ncbi:MAG TPA: bifunctional UDP-sugar hydrolase/5'-nucleotidase [Polyangiales bacterium]|nr:bifunctional UDP-sugar hydrolase/5'-nucleotidase [Polyangiales bacterium]